MRPSRTPRHQPQKTTARVLSPKLTSLTTRAPTCINNTRPLSSYSYINAKAALSLHKKKLTWVSGTPVCATTPSISQQTRLFKRMEALNITSTKKESSSMSHSSRTLVHHHPSRNGESSSCVALRCKTRKLLTQSSKRTRLSFSNSKTAQKMTEAIWAPFSTQARNKWSMQATIQLIWGEIWRHWSIWCSLFTRCSIQILTAPKRRKSSPIGKIWVRRLMAQAVEDIVMLMSWMKRLQMRMNGWGIIWSQWFWSCSSLRRRKLEWWKKQNQR